MSKMLKKLDFYSKEEAGNRKYLFCCGLELRRSVCHDSLDCLLFIVWWFSMRRVDLNKKLWKNLAQIWSQYILVDTAV